MTQPPPQLVTIALLATFTSVAAGCFDFGGLDAKDPKDAGGDDADTAVECAAGDCAHSFKPTYIGDADRLTSGTVRVTIAAGEEATWNVDSGLLSHGGADGGVNTVTIEPWVEDQGEGVPSIAVFSVKSFEIEKNASLTFEGARAVAILSAEDIVIDGLLDVSGNGTTGGPGGESATEDPQPSAAHSGRRGTGTNASSGTGFVAFAFSGGGGGSNGTSGAHSGDADATQTAVSTNTASVPGASPGALQGIGSLREGGAGGGATGVSFANDLNGGGGGGALLLASATSIRVGTNGAVDAGGAGGPPPAGEASVIGAGPGGGAGGTILLEAPGVTIAGGVFANGGGGCGADSHTLALGSPGEDGRRGPDPAEGSASVGDFDDWDVSRGGSGAAGPNPEAEPSEDAEVTRAMGVAAAASGGGGGGAGRIAILTLTGEIEGDGEISPKSAATYDVDKLDVLD